MPSCSALAVVAVVLIAAGPGITLAAEGAAGDAPRSASEWLDEGYRLKAEGDRAGADRAFQQARAAGADGQLVALERGYLALSRGDRAAARPLLGEAAGGKDERLARQARAELDQLPGRFSGDAYFEAFGWSRVEGEQKIWDVVPTLRVRGHFRPWLDGETTLYLAAQATRDTASRGGSPAALPLVYADNHALLAAGVATRFWGRRAGLFAQAGAAFNLIDDGKPPVSFDARAGAYYAVESAGCRPPVGPTRLLLRWCAESYGEAAWFSRFDDDVVVFARGRAGATLLLTGPVAWQLLGEVRAAVDRNQDYYDNFVDGGADLRWRLLRGLPLDLTVGVHAGTYLGVEGVDPAPSPLHFVDLRVGLATSLEF